VAAGLAVAVEKVGSTGPVATGVEVGFVASIGASGSEAAFAEKGVKWIQAPNK
jgi:hypothetical protein